MMMQVLIVENDTELATVLRAIVEIDRNPTVTGIAGDLDGAIAPIEAGPSQSMPVDRGETE